MYYQDVMSPDNNEVHHGLIQDFFVGKGILLLGCGDKKSFKFEVASGAQKAC